MATERVEILMLGVDCEAPTIERTLQRIPGVIAVSVNPATEIAYFDYDTGQVTREGLLAAVKDLGYRAQLV